MTKVLLSLGDTTQTVKEWALDYGIPELLIRSRLKHGWSVERAITTPMRAEPGQRLPEPKAQAKRASPASARTYTLDGHTLTLSEWAERLGMTYSALSQRLWNGWTVERALTEPMGAFTQKRCETRRRKHAQMTEAA